MQYHHWKEHRFTCVVSIVALCLQGTHPNTNTLCMLSGDQTDTCVNLQRWDGAKSAQECSNDWNVCLGASSFGVLVGAHFVTVAGSRACAYLLSESLSVFFKSNFKTQICVCVLK